MVDNNTWTVVKLPPYYGEDRGWWAKRGGSQFQHWHECSGPYDTKEEAERAVSLVTSRIAAREAAKEGRYTL